MSKSQSKSRSSIDPALVRQLTVRVLSHAPRERVMTLTEIEEGVTTLLRQLGTELTEAVMAEQISEAEKKGHRATVATTPCAGGAFENAPSSRNKVQ
jgi:hypothetical protein